MTFTTALFDLDGTLIDSEPCYARINQEYINKYGDGKEYTWETRKDVMGKSAQYANQKIIETHHIQSTWEEVCILLERVRVAHP